MKYTGRCVPPDPWGVCDRSDAESKGGPGEDIQTSIVPLRRLPVGRVQGAVALDGLVPRRTAPTRETLFVVHSPPRPELLWVGGYGKTSPLVVGEVQDSSTPTPPVQ